MKCGGLLLLLLWSSTLSLFSRRLHLAFTRGVMVYREEFMRFHKGKYLECIKAARAVKQWIETVELRKEKQDIRAGQSSLPVCRPRLTASRISSSPGFEREQHGGLHRARAGDEEHASEVSARPDRRVHRHHPQHDPRPATGPSPLLSIDRSLLHRMAMLPLSQSLVLSKKGRRRQTSLASTTTTPTGTQRW
jgi:hypothetical protein